MSIDTQKENQSVSQSAGISRGSPSPRFSTTHKQLASDQGREGERHARWQVQDGAPQPTCQPIMEKSSCITVHRFPCVLSVPYALVWISSSGGAFLTHPHLHHRLP